ncbi:MAG: ATP-binding cassette domain-containing protein [Propionibacteriaceae bacterium]|nr:ATP-binding cassette domain-containing protein [Propionibacteriaceae bacterium]
MSKSFHGLNAVDHLDLRVPEGSIYGFIGENGSGKSTAEKLICGLLVPSGGSISLYGRPHTDPVIRSQIGLLIENPGCFPNSTVYQNLLMQALNLDLRRPQEEVGRVLKLVSLVSAAGRRYKDCSLGMKQRLGVAQALLGHPRLLILDEPINGLDADGIRIVRETLIELNRSEGVTVLISSHILGELSKIATHYGILRAGALIRQTPASALSAECRDFVAVKTDDDPRAQAILRSRYSQVEPQDGVIRVYDETDSSSVSGFLHQHGVGVAEISYQTIGLEEYYLQIMSHQTQESRHA